MQPFKFKNVGRREENVKKNLNKSIKNGKTLAVSNICIYLLNKQRLTPTISSFRPFFWLANFCLVLNFWNPCLLIFLFYEFSLLFSFSGEMHL
jgi:hypothetical protein